MLQTQLVVGVACVQMSFIYFLRRKSDAMKSEKVKSGWSG